MSLNIRKTHYIVFTHKKQINLNNNILINNQIVSRVESTKFLGVIIDSALTWKDHINYIKTKIAKGIGIICKGRKYFNTSTLLTLYYSFIYPYLTYCVEVWGNTSNCYLNSLSKLQKRTIRIITSANYRAHTDPLFNSLTTRGPGPGPYIDHVLHEGPRAGAFPLGQHLVNGRHENTFCSVN